MPQLPAMSKINDFNLDLRNHKILIVLIGQLALKYLSWLLDLWQRRKIKHDIVRLQISVDHIGVVQLYEPVSYLLDYEMSFCLA